jgi:rhodanese-related sulfurtransferase
MIKNGDPLTIIDVRSKDEFRQGHIPGAKVIPLDQITKKLDKIPKSHPVVFTCLSGTRSRMAAGQVANMGFENIYNHQGGFRAWQQAGLPVKR